MVFSDLLVRAVGPVVTALAMMYHVVSSKPVATTDLSTFLDVLADIVKFSIVADMLYSEWFRTLISLAAAKMCSSS